MCINEKTELDFEWKESGKVVTKDIKFLLLRSIQYSWLLLNYVDIMLF